MFGVCLVRHDFQEALVTGDTTDIFGRPGARSIDTGPVLWRDIKRHEFLDHDSVAPVITEVIDVIEHGSMREVAEANLTTIKDAGVVFIRILRQEPDIAIAQSANLELVQMIVPPVEGRLNGKMQLPKVPARRQNKSTPDFRLDLIQRNVNLDCVDGFEHAACEQDGSPTIKS